MASNKESTKNADLSPTKGLNASAKAFTPQGYSTKPSSKCKVMETIQEPISSEDDTTTEDKAQSEPPLSINTSSKNNNSMVLYNRPSKKNLISTKFEPYYPLQYIVDDFIPRTDFDYTDFVKIPYFFPFDSVYDNSVNAQTSTKNRRNALTSPQMSIPIGELQMKSQSQSQSRSESHGNVISEQVWEMQQEYSNKLYHHVYLLERRNRVLREYGGIPAQLRGYVSVSKEFTRTIIPQLIAEEIYDIYNYMDKLMAFDDNKLPLITGKNVVINFNFHEKKSNEKLFCIIETQNSGQRKWRMLDQLFTAKMIEDQYNVHPDDLPVEHVCIRGEAYIIDLHQALDETKWGKIRVYAKKNNKQRQVFHITTNEFKKILKQKIENKYQTIPTIPIVAEDGNLEHVMIIDLTEQVSIGISFRINASYCWRWNGYAEITGIYLDKEEILLRHQLYDPKHECHCLDHFESNINELKIGHIYNEQNQIKNLRLQNKDLRKEHKNPIIKYIKQILNDVNDLISNDMRAALSAIKQIFNVDTIKNAINNCRNSKQEPQSSTITTNITSNASNIPISYLTTICGSYATTTKLVTLPPPPLNAALRSIPQQQ